LGLVSLAVTQSPAEGRRAVSTDTEPRILRRTLALSRDDSGRYRAVEVLELELGGAAGQPVDLVEGVALLRLPEAVLGFLSLGGDVPASRLIYEPPTLILSPGPGAPVIRVAFTYMLASEADRLEVAALLPVAELLLEVDRATVDARPDRRLAPAPEAGLELQSRFRANELAPGSVLTVDLGSRRIGWRERFAVFLTTAGAATAAGIWLWRAARPIGPTRP
jgi:hypothetical protein